jgi:vitamin B12 transporter
VMIDGIRITDPSTADNAIDLSEISLSNIERIEIVRGAQSSLYGSSAIGGVINIITKKGMTPGVHVDANVMGGTFGPKASVFTENLFLNYSHKSGFYVNGEIFHNHTNGLDATVDTITDNMKAYGSTLYNHQHRGRNDFNKTDAMAKLGYHTSKADIFASYKREDQSTNIDQGAFTDDRAYNIGFGRNLFTCGAAYTFNNHFDVSYLGGMTDLKRLAVDDSSVVDSSGAYNHNYFKGTFRGSTITNELQAHYHTKGLSVVAGGCAFNEKMSASTYYFSSSFGRYETRQNLDSLHISVTTISEFVHADLDGSMFYDKLSILALSLGARNTQHQLFGNNFTYDINPSLKIPGNGLLFASWSTGFNAPSLYQLYAPDQYLPGGITRGNPNLKPETSKSMEFGFKQRVNEDVSFHFSYFKTVVDNSIDYVYLWSKNKPADSLTFNDYLGDTYVNIGRQTNQGFEFGINTRLTSRIFISGNVSLINGKLEYDPAIISTQHTQGNQVQLFANGAFLNSKVESYGLVRRPSTANISLTYKPIKALSVRVALRYAGPRTDVYYNSTLGPNGAQATKEMGDYTLVDLSLRYSIFKALNAGIRVENLFDEKYYEIYGYTTRGRSVYLSLNYSF